MHIVRPYFYTEMLKSNIFIAPELVVEENTKSQAELYIRLPWISHKLSGAQTKIIQRPQQDFHWKI